MQDMVLKCGSMNFSADKSKQVGLDPGMLYDSVIELANEGQLTAGCISAAAGILLTELGLPKYFFRNISNDALKRILRSIAMNLQLQDGRFILRGEVSEVQFDVDGGVQVRIATVETRDRMEAILNSVMSGHRVEYYFGPKNQYYTYIIRPEVCKKLVELKPGESPFAFNQIKVGPPIPDSTRRRYEAFFKKISVNVVPLIEVSDAPSTRETRVMFHEDFSGSSLPVIRQILGELDIRLNRVYWETYRGPTGRVESICSLYLANKSTPVKMKQVVVRIQTLLALHECELDHMYVSGALNFDEFVFATNAYIFVHSFINKNLNTDTDIMEALGRKELRDAMSTRIFNSNRSEYTRKWIKDIIKEHPDLIKGLFRIFDRKFNPAHKTRPNLHTIQKQIDNFQRHVAVTFIDDKTSQDIFAFMAQIITHTYKTNFYKGRKRSFAFRLSSVILDPLVFSSKVYGIFFVVGFYSIGTHMRAEEIARGGLRLIRVTPGNYDNELDNMPLLNYALGPVAQRLKHKDIAESGAKGVIVPNVIYSNDGLEAIFDLTEGIMDLIQQSDDVLDYLGKPEMIFFGPDEGTAGFMDAVAQRARERGYKYWRTITTGKSIGIPHDTYGLTRDQHVFGLLSHGVKGTELQLDGITRTVTTDMGKIYDKIGNRITSSGMTTMCVMACFRTMLEHAGLKEEDVHLMMTGGPDGDLGANQIQSFKGKICLIIDGGSILFDPTGLDRKELMKIAFNRHAEPRQNSLAYPEEKLSTRGFKVPRIAGRFKLPGGGVVEDGIFFHRNFLSSPENRKYIVGANIQAFVPCGGFKDTINVTNVRQFTKLFQELKVIVEGANVFFDDTSRDVIACETSILQIKDSSANKGGVMSSSIAEVLSSFLLGEEYDKFLVRNPKTRSELIRAVFNLITESAVAETKMLLALHEKNNEPLYMLSVKTSEMLYALQDRLYKNLPSILHQRNLVETALQAYIPAALLKRIGMPKVMRIFTARELKAYRDAILTKKLAAIALYRHATEWDTFTSKLDTDLIGTLDELVNV